MGADKATLVVDGEVLARRVARVLTAVCDTVVEVGGGVSELPCVREQPPGAGPLAAALAGMEFFDTTGPTIVLACDLPCIDEAALRFVADHPASGSVVPVVAGRPQLACARWSASAIAYARSAYADGARALGVLLDAPDTVTVDADAWARAFADVDSPEDLARLGLS
jgi:molybdopterin-guanine dinucleotide biosynthesis protein A